MQLSKNEKIKKELVDYQNKINSLTDEVARAELNRLLSQLVNGIKSIDQQHLNLSFGGNASNGLRDTREALSAVRKKLEKKLQDYKHQGLIKE
jgi:hypothetical protein